MSKEIKIFDGKITITPLIKAQKKLNEALTLAHTQLEKDGAIQRFEFTYELL